MGSISSMGVALSGLKAAQAALSVTGHNVSNSSVSGYTRQQIIQQDYRYRSIGSSAVGSLVNQIGLGSDVAYIRQTRNRFYDANYRGENSGGNFYARKYTAGEEINNIIGELESEYRAQNAINGIWVSVNELTKNPGGIETRATFIQNAVTFLDKVKDINSKLYEYQNNLNGQVKEEVGKINTIVEQIAELNLKIEQVESDGRRANDFRDERNSLLDELSGFLDIEVKETVNPNGKGTRIDILVSGQELLTNNIPSKIGLRYNNGEYPLYEPVFTNSTEILPFTEAAIPLFPNLATEDLTSTSSSTKGSLKGLLISRGNVIGNHTMNNTAPEQIGNFLIPKLQHKIDKLAHEVVTLLNNSVTSPGAGMPPFDLNGNPGIPIFLRKSGSTLPEDPLDPATLYTIENLEINPLLLQNDGYNRLAFSSTGDVGDTTILKSISNAWKAPSPDLDNSSIDGYYKKVITDFGIEIQESRQKLDSKIGTTSVAQNQRLSISAVSLDEELSNMLKFQHAYNSASKVINVIDSMIDKIINGTGRAGL